MTRTISTAVTLAIVAATTTTAADANTATTARAQAEATARAIVAANAPTDLPNCLGPAAANPAPGTPEWDERDRANQYCATERLQDEYGSPAFGSTFWAETPGIFAGQNVEMLMNPTHPHVTLAQVIPGGTTTDPYRTIDRWNGHRGRVDKVSFTATDGATLNGYLFRPPATVPGPYPGVVITTGSIQGYQHMYFWAAEGLAEAGYEVLTYDVQGQGTSDTFGADCTPPNRPSTAKCTGVPFQNDYNFYQGTEDALNFFFSNANPGRADLDEKHVGIAGHSLGASAVSEIGQCDPRVDAIVGWDKLLATGGTCASKAANLPADAPATPSLKTPALGINSEYFFNPTSQSKMPAPLDQAFQQLKANGTDTMQIALRASTHLEYTYVPYILPASRLGERVAWYYTLAWFDKYLRHDPTALGRLTTTVFDGSADASSIGAGTYDPARAAANPTDTTAGNVPYKIKDLPVADRLSFYYVSEYSLSHGANGRLQCADMRQGC